VPGRGGSAFLPAPAAALARTAAPAAAAPPTLPGFLPASPPPQQSLSRMPAASAPRPPINLARMPNLGGLADRASAAAGAASSAAGAASSAGGAGEASYQSTLRRVREELEQRGQITDEPF
jgi:hypothetical protein